MLFTIQHYFIGLPLAVLQPIAEGKIIDPDVGNAFYIIWIFSTVTMFLTGATLLFISTDLRLLRSRAWKLALLISLGLTGFGLGMTIRFPDFAPIALQFLIVGLITLTPLLIFAGSYTVRDTA
jgi:hypothetical protein